MCRHRESNLDLGFRKPLFYPLNYASRFFINFSAWPPDQSSAIVSYYTSYLSWSLPCLPKRKFLKPKNLLDQSRVCVESRRQAPIAPVRQMPTSTMRIPGSKSYWESWCSASSPSASLWWRRINTWCIEIGLDSVKIVVNEFLVIKKTATKNNIRFRWNYIPSHVGFNRSLGNIYPNHYSSSVYTFNSISDSGNISPWPNKYH